MSTQNITQTTGDGDDNTDQQNACTVQDCRCPKFIGSGQDCGRANCHHSDNAHPGGDHPTDACSVQDCGCSRFAGDDIAECSRSNCRHGGGYHTKRRSGDACSTQGCPCPKAVGNQTDCNRQGCGHPVVHHNVAARDGPCVDCDCSEFVGDASTPCGRAGCGHDRNARKISHPQLQTKADLVPRCLCRCRLITKS
ncbi:hypothetical protein BJV77DRAFT_1003488 [Russula vinacea]|nr:hypothetical protein BJV77DRAFT_1003488 [Russula vinacea]